VLFVEFLHVFLVHGQLRAHFLPNHPLRDDLVPHILLELFIRSPCASAAFSRSSMVSSFISLRIHRGASPVPCPRNAKVLAFLQQKLLVNQFLQHVALFFAKKAVGVAGSCC